MPNLPEFNQKAKEALAIAQNTAIKQGHTLIGTEHLLFGILSLPQEGSIVQVNILGKGTQKDFLSYLKNKELGKFQPKKTQNTKEDDKYTLPEVTDEFQLVLDQSIRTADEYRYTYIGTEHLLYAILAVPDTHGSKLMNVNNSGTQIKKAILSTFESHAAKMGGKQEDIAEETNQSNPFIKQKKKSALETYAHNLNKKVLKNKEFRILEREEEMSRLVEILSRKEKNNPILLGEAGVGKTALVEGLAVEINKKNVPEWLQDKQIYSLDVAGMLAGSVFRGEFESRLKQVLEEIETRGNIILFIDEVHDVIGAGSGGVEKGPDMSNIMKPAMARGEISIIGATTEQEYKHIKKNKAFARRFQAITLEEPSVAKTIQILKQAKDSYENYHDSQISEQIIERLVNLADRYMSGRHFPDKAFDVLDECLVKAKIKTYIKTSKTNHVKNKEWLDLESQILDLIKQKNKAVIDGDEDLVNDISKKRKQLESEFEKLTLEQKTSKKSVVTKEILEEVVSHLSGVPIDRISTDISVQVKDLESELKAEIFGQDEAIKEVVGTLKLSHAKVNPNKGPIASFLLLGPTGVGKTELVKSVTKHLYGDLKKYLLKLDMSEFRERHQMSRLLGSPAGYVGYDDDPQLTTFIQKNPYSVILFDEIEKGHPESLNILLQLLEDGVITDAKGETIDCSNVLVFLTSNLGRNKLNRYAQSIGFNTTEDVDADYTNIKNQVMDVVEKQIKPEILGRLKSKIVFKPLDKDSINKVVMKELNILKTHLITQGRILKINEKVVQKLLDIATSKENVQYGAREVKSLVTKEIQAPLADYILDNPSSKKIVIALNSKGGIVGKKLIENVAEKKQKENSTVDN